VPRQIQEVLVEPWLRDALIRLNPEIAAQPDRADEVLYKLRAIVLSVRSDGLIRANEEMTAWMRGERSMPFGPNNEHVPVRLIDLDDLAQNQYIVTQQFTYRAGPTERRADLVLLVNGLPLVLIEAKTPVKKCISWVDGAVQVHDDYEKFVPELFVCNVFSVATEGKAYHYGSIGLPVKDWGPWHLDGDGDDGQHHPLKSLKLSPRACCARMWCWTSSAASPCSPPTRKSSASRSSAATSSLKRPTRSSSACWRVTPGRA
jgi:type I restriction enzyme R subunit